MSETENRMGKARILVADGLPFNREIINEILKHEYELFFASDGLSVIDSALSFAPDLILLDAMLPKMDGYDALKILKKSPDLKDIPVIILTAANDERNESLGLGLGAVDYITKPYSPMHVRLRVRNQIELKLQRDMLVKLSSLDGLTGIPNRRVFEEYFDREWLRAVRGEVPISLLMLDLDEFRAFNETNGYAQGDTTLRTVALTLAATLNRPADMLARFDGDRFVCVLPETDATGASLMANKLKDRNDELAIPNIHARTADRLTLSIGGVSTLPYKFPDETYFVRKTLEMLHRAKTDGRNRVVLFSMENRIFH